MIDILEHDADQWLDVKDSAMHTIGKTHGTYPDSEWKRKMLLAEHSPIRRLRFFWRWNGLKSWVSVHFVRHKHGIEHWVSTQRSDRTGVMRDNLPQDAPVNHSCEANAQALINISRKRLCSCASPETREAWMEVKAKVAETEPELASVMVPECIYRGFCPEIKSCGYANTEAYYIALQEYRGRQVFGRVEKKEKPIEVVAANAHRDCQNCRLMGTRTTCNARDTCSNYSHDRLC